MAYLLYAFRQALFRLNIARSFPIYSGKHVIVGITFIDGNGKILERFQTHGRIAGFEPRSGILIEKADGSGTYTLPPGLGNLAPARPGIYRLKSTGEEVVNPDYISNWTVRDTVADTVMLYKKCGFKGPFQT